MHVRLAIFLFLLSTLALPAQLQTGARGLKGIEVKTIAQISQPHVSTLGKTALAVDPEAWLHAETENFIYHFRNPVSTTAASQEAEFFYRVIAADLEKDRTAWQRKAHLFLFEDAGQWKKFRVAGGLDPWTGGLIQGNELYILRDDKSRFKGRTLGHEIAHLVINRFFPGQIPLWLNEGYAENISRKAYAAFARARGYDARAGAPLVPKKDFIPLERLMNLQSYPETVGEVSLFYSQSDSLVRFLIEKDKAKFLRFFQMMASGATHDTALSACYFGDFSTVAKLDEAFRADTASDGVWARRIQ